MDRVRTFDGCRELLRHGITVGDNAVTTLERELSFAQKHPALSAAIDPANGAVV